MSRLVSLFALYIVLILNTQIFRLNALNPLSIPFSQEFFLALSMVCSVCFISNRCITTGRINSLLFIVFLIPITMVLHSALLAHVVYGQPIFYGLVESRRILAVWAVFPLLILVSSLNLSRDDIARHLIFVGLLCCLLITAVFTDVIAVSSTPEINENNLRSERVSFASVYVCFACALSIFRFVKTNNKLYLVAFIIMCFVIVGISQSRGLLVVLLVSLLPLMRSPKFLLLFLLLIVIFLSSSAAVLYTDIFSSALSEEYLSASLRSLGIAHVLGQGLDWVGQGALSLIWRDGFDRVIHDGFFLSDIGLFGSYFRFGFIFLVYYLLFFIMFIKCLKRSPHSDSRSFIVGQLIGIVVLFPIAAPIEFKGFLLALLLLLACCQEKLSKKGENPV